MLHYTLHTVCPARCDSIVHRHLIVKPILRVEVDTTLCPEQLPFCYCENGKEVTLSDNYPLTRVETLSSRQYGCDSIVTYQINVNEVDLHPVYDTICYNQRPYSFNYPSTGIESQPLEKQRLLNFYNDTVAYDTMRHEGHCLHIVELHLKINPIYDTTLQIVPICQGQATYEWRRESLHDVHRGELIKEIPLPISGGNPEEDFIYYHVFDTTISTNQTECDSTLHLPIIIYRTYFKADTVSISDKESFTWIKNRQDTIVYGVNSPDKPVSIEGLEPSTEYYLYRDSLHSIHGCDSVHYQYVYVRPTFTVWDSAYVCQDRDNNYQWSKHENSAHIFNEHSQNISTIPLDPAGEFIYFDSLKTVAGDDSIFGLYMMVYPTYYLPVQRTDIHICDNQQYHFHTAYFDTVYNTDGNLKRGDETLYYFDILKTDSTIHGCDSAVWHRVFVHPTYYREKEDSVCQTSPYLWDGHDAMAGHNNPWIWDVQHQKRIGRDAIPTNMEAGVYTYIDSLQTETCTECSGNGCDSIWVLKLRVDSIYAHYDTITMSDEETRKWQHTVYIGSKVHSDTLSASWFDGETQQQIVRIPDKSIVNDFDTTYPTIHKCDSIFYLHLLVGPTFRDTIEGWTCDNEPYHWYHADDSVHESRPDITILTPGLYYDSLRTQLFGFDSIYVLDLHNYPTYHYSEEDTVCQLEPYHWSGHEESEYFYLVEELRWVHRDNISTDMWGHYTYIDSLKTHEPELHPNQNRHSGCDSIWTLHLYIPHTYHFYDTLPLCENDTLHWQGMLFGGSQYEAYGKAYGNTAVFDSTVLNLTHGTYHRDIRRPTIHDCDSTYHLTLYVHEVAHTDSLDSVCQGHPFYNPNWNWGEGMYMNTERVGTYVSVDTIHSVVTNCDSIVTFTLRVDSVYDYRPYFEFCQDTIHTDTIVEWKDEAGKPHTFRLDISKADTFTYTDSLTSVHGCDSIFGVTWMVHPIYRFDSVYHICENERLVWQHKQYTGDSVLFDTNDTIILTPGIYRDTMRYMTYEGCFDSTYYMTVYVHPIYDVTTYATTCYNESYVWKQSDKNGNYNTMIWQASTYDTIFIRSDEALNEQIFRDTIMLCKDTMLRTIDDCDSLSRLRLTIPPTYFFYTDTIICSNEYIMWRDKHIAMKDTVEALYTDSLKTEKFGCDSVYQLHILFKPAYVYSKFRELCDNETQYYPDNGSFIIWKPGDDIPRPGDYIERAFKTKEGCDSTYRYYLTIHPTYFTDKSVESLCSNEQYKLHDHKIVSADTIFDVHYKIEPWDMIFVDTLSSIYGCDSVYWMKTRINPVYHYHTYDTICDNDHYVWRGNEYHFGGENRFSFSWGENNYKEAYKTVENCDSIYELHLMVHRTYSDDTSMTKCENDNLRWRRFNLDTISVGYHVISDSLTSVYGCDSIYNLYLTVNPVVDTVCYDTICFGETYYYGNKKAYEDGVYRDTVKSIRYGCDSIILAYLEVIEPTVPTAWADSICADDEAYDLFYTYTGEYDPIAYSVKYDEEGHRNGFEDIIDQPITSPDELSWLRIPMPNVKEDRTNYPKPNYYNITLILDNGRCKDPEKWCSTDTSIVLSYPSWITRQRFGDVIALYNDKYNGGYKWWNYQWYHGNELLPGETHEYLYVPTGLVVGDQYHVRLTREGEVQDFQTCPITIVADPIDNDFAPTMGYLSVVPTCVCQCHPYIYILSRKDGMYRITTTDGNLAGEGVFHADVTEEAVPATPGMYIVQLWSNDTPEEPYRNIKIIVNPKCVPEHYENISF